MTVLLRIHRKQLKAAHPVHQRLESHLQINADAFCDELTANLIKLEKVTLYDTMQMLVTLIRFFLNSCGLFF
ncbi:hypothetical protein CIB84_007304 [Bambusicola thoracicus]|uniref:Uncharacterized protein n=1 Tax=Bambusicola thoracicus TaxID=9083 RepID=A0A2P4SXW2_BAMTH|nr:hypothetical protein CIB84_007304 [Bambusicola thoracicus]